MGYKIVVHGVIQLRCAELTVTLRVSKWSQAVREAAIHDVAGVNRRSSTVTEALSHFRQPHKSQIVGSGVLFRGSLPFLPLFSRCLLGNENDSRARAEEDWPVATLALLRSVVSVANWAFGICAEALWSHQSQTLVSVERCRPMSRRIGDRAGEVKGRGLATRRHFL